MTFRQHNEQSTLLYYHQQPSMDNDDNKKQKRTKGMKSLIVPVAFYVLVGLASVMFTVSSIRQKSLFSSSMMNSLAYPFDETQAQYIARERKQSYLDRNIFVMKDNEHVLSEGCESTVLIVRHCEKTRVKEHCDYVGYERSVFLPTLFGNNGEKWPTPSYLYATNPGGRGGKHVYREIELILPLAKKFNLTINDEFHRDNSTELMANMILTTIHSGEMCGKLALVSWRHSDIAHLAHKLGCGPMDGCPLDYPGAEFDLVWELKFVYRRFADYTEDGLVWQKKPQWRILGSMQYQGFDPLSFSKKYGDYPRGGTPYGARWFKDADPIPERTLIKSISRKGD